MSECSRVDADVQEIKDWSDGGKSWWLAGKLHRTDGPAVEGLDGKMWAEHGQLHRVDGPAIEHADGSGEWFLRGKRHRVDGPAIEHPGDVFDTKAEWYQHGRLHRIDGPAIQWVDGTEQWYLDGKLHRLDGPAFDGIDEKVWYIHGKRLQPEKYQLHILRLQRFCKSLKLRRLLKLLQTKQFVESFYAPEQMGGRWAKRSLEKLFAS
jgi:hypothetical protein